MSRLRRGGGKEWRERESERETEVCWGPLSPAAGRLPDCR